MWRASMRIVWSWGGSIMGRSRVSVMTGRSVSEDGKGFLLVEFGSINDVNLLSLFDRGLTGFYFL